MDAEHPLESKNGEILNIEVADAAIPDSSLNGTKLPETGHDGNASSSTPTPQKQCRRRAPVPVPKPKTMVTADDKEWRSHPQVQGMMAKWEFLLENKLFTDFKCLVGPHKEPIECHSLVLKMQSRYFENAFAKELSDEMEVPNCEPVVFKKFLKYLYTDKVEFVADDAMDGLTLARKFNIPSLPAQCEAIVMEGIAPDNAASLLKKAEEMQDKHLALKVQEFILKNASQVVFTPTFTEISIVSLQKLLAANRALWKLKEVKILECVKQWAAAECARRGLEDTGPNQYVVARHALDLIHYKQFSPLEFTNEVVKPKLLPPERLLDIQSELIEKENKIRNSHPHSVEDDLRFMETQQRRVRPSSPEPVHMTDGNAKIDYDKVYSLIRYTSAVPKEWKPDKDNGSYKISVQVSRQINLVGLALYGHANDTDPLINVTISITNYEEDTAILELEKQTVASEEGGESEVLFPHPVTLDALHWYTISVTTGGRIFPMGIGGKRTYAMDIDHDPVSFYFRNSKDVSGASHVRGQLPKMFFSVPPSHVHLRK